MTDLSGISVDGAKLYNNNLKSYIGCGMLGS